MSSLIHKVEPYLITPNMPISIQVIGCGGTGSLLLSKLARLNISLLKSDHPGMDVIAIDGDYVTESNQGRQGFYPFDTGQNKAEILIARINRSFGFSWKAIPEFVTDTGSANVKFICVDSMETRRMFYEKITSKNLFWNDYHQAKPYYIIDCGNSYHQGQVVLYSKDKKTKSFIDLFGDAEIADEKAPSCSTFVNLNEQSLFINDIISTYAVQMLYELLSEYELTYNGILFDFNSKNPIVKIPLSDEKNDVYRDNFSSY